ncbi:Protein KTI12 [Blattella germanica]|nr:Protein KTI12 [Blattella germanica]
MPLILITGIPSSGKSTRTSQLKTFFEETHKKAVHVVSESEIISESGNVKNTLFADSTKEKTVRGLLKSKAERLINREDIVIIDAGNYIKGYRYELYCMSKASKTTQCTVHCEIPVETAWKWNCDRGEDEKYSREIFDALTMRYEPPDSRNRWDSPLFTVLPEDQIPTDEMFSALFERKAPPPNQSTQCAPLSSTNFLYEMDRITQDVVSAILSAQKLGLEGEVKIPGYKDCVLLTSGATLTPAQLSRLRRQFLLYLKLHPATDINKIGPLFIQFLNTSLS